MRSSEGNYPSGPSRGVLEAAKHAVIVDVARSHWLKDKVEVHEGGVRWVKPLSPAEEGVLEAILNEKVVELGIRGALRLLGEAAILYVDGAEVCGEEVLAVKELLEATGLKVKSWRVSAEPDDDLKDAVNLFVTYWVEGYKVA